MRACYGVTEAEILSTWSLADFEHYLDFARDVWLKRGG